MIIQIQNHLKGILLDTSKLSEDFIFTNPPNSNISGSWISIIPAKATFSAAWHWDNSYHNLSENDKDIVKIQRKYNTIQPIIIHFEYESKELLSDSVDEFLLYLPKEISVNRTKVSFLPKELEYIFPKGELGVFSANLTIESGYGIQRHDTKNDAIIKGVHFNVSHD